MPGGFGEDLLIEVRSVIWCRRQVYRVAVATYMIKLAKALVKPLKGAQSKKLNVACPWDFLRPVTSMPNLLLIHTGSTSRY